MKTRPKPTTPPVPPPDDVRRKLAALADWQRQWSQSRLDGPFTPRGEDSDYNLHYVDVDGDDDEFHDRARQIMGLDDESALTKSAETAALSTVHHPLGTHGLWGDKKAQLPAYIQNIAHSLMRDGHGESSAIQMAIGAVKRWATGGGKVSPEVRAAAAKAVAEWEKLKAEHGPG